MSKRLFAANTTNQTQELHYWVAGVTKPLVETIPPGHQIELCKSRPCTSGDYEDIIRQISLYGAIPVKDIGSGHKYAGICYQFDKEIDVDAILAGFNSNNEALEDRSLEQRKAVAATVSENLNQVSGGKVAEVELSIEEQQKPGSNADTMAETISVTADGAKPRKQRNN